MCLVVFGHRKNGDLRNRAFFPVDSSRAFVKRRKVGVQITGIAAATGHFFSCGGDFAQGFGVVRNIRRDANDSFKKLAKEDVSEDEIKELEDKVQKLTDKYIKDVDAAVEAKGKEIMTV